jgi:glycosyltransferase involved in cell wall biosynthesis
MISIAMATFNGSFHILEQLESFNRQSIQPDELIVFDDGSTDNTVEIIKEFSNSSTFLIRIYVNDLTLGYSQNFSKALSKCQGDFIFLSDQDDVWLDNKIETVLNKFESSEHIHLLIHDLDFCDTNLKLLGQTKIERISKVADPMLRYVTGMATVVRKDFLKMCLPILKRESHDIWLHKCALALNVKGIIYESLSLYRRHDSNVTLADPLNSITNIDAKNLIVNNKFRDNTKESLMESIYFIEGFHNWLINSSGKAEFLGFTDINYFSKELDNISARLNFMKMRVDIISVPRVYRIAKIFNFYKLGGYSIFSGYKSLLKDILNKYE